MNSQYRHGGEVYALARQMSCSPESFVDFSSNSHCFALDITERLVRDTPYPFLHYPDSSAAVLVRAVADHESVEPERVLPGNGASQLIWLALQGLEPRHVLFIGPVFSEQIVACETLGISYEIRTPAAENEFTLSGDDLEAIWNSDADLAVLCTPNNPAGVTYPNMEQILRVLRAPRVIVDNSYREFLFPSGDYALNHINTYAAMARPGVSVLTLNSFGKFFCCPGIRLGYLLGERMHLQRIASRQPAWSVSPFAQAIGATFLKHVGEYRERLEPMRDALADLGRQLRRLRCVDPDLVLEGPGFVCCGLAPGYEAGKIYSALLQLRLIVRNCDSIPGMPPGFIRIQARPRDDAYRLLKAMEMF